MTLFSIIEQINRKELFLPHIQRPFVWEEDQMVRLFDSLMQNFPIQTLLFWRTKERIKARLFMQQIEWDCELSKYYDDAASQEGREKTFVLDGQQRLQTLYGIFYGSIDAQDGKTPLYAYLDITKGTEPDNDGLHYKLEFKPVNPGLPYFQINELMGKYNQKNSEEIADVINEDLDIHPLFKDQTDEFNKLRRKTVRRNISQLTSLLREDKYFWMQTLDGVAESYQYKTIRDIFVRVNSGGTKLDAADLMFAVMKENWEPIEELVEQTVALLNETKLNFDKNFVLKCIVTTLTGDARVDVDKFSGEGSDQLLNSIETNWNDFEKTFQSLRDFVVNDLKLYGDKIIRSYNSLVPLFDYLYHNHGPDSLTIQRMRGYFFKSQLFNWYRAQTDVVINGLHKFTGHQCDNGFPLEEIVSYFSERKSITVLTSDHLRESRLRFIVLNILYVEKFGNNPFDVRYMGNEPQIDHIFPKSMLYRKFELPTSDVNHLGNYRFVGAYDNLRKRAEMPDVYFHRLKQSGIDISKHLLLSDYSDHPELLTFDRENYFKFRDQRVDAIFRVVSKVVNPEVKTV
jgi:hypothetical protein